MRVIVTRPASSGHRTAKALRRRGHDPVLLPLTEPIHDAAAAGRALQRPHGAITVTSAEAIRVLESLGEALAPHRSTPLFCVGTVTAAAAGAAGFTHVQAAGGNGADLAARILAHVAATGRPAGPLLYLAGQPRSPSLEQALAEAGLPFETVECYRMRPVEQDPDLLHALLIDATAEAVLLYSRETAERFFALPPFANGLSPLANTRFYCLSANIAKAVPARLSERVFVAASADEGALLDLL